MRVLFLGLIGILLACTILCAAQCCVQPYVVCGHVYDDNGKVVKGVEVTLKNLRTGEVQRVLTNDKGEFLFECLNFKQGFRDGDLLEVACKYETKVVKVDVQYAGIQVELNKPSGVDVKPIIAGTILISVAGGLYFYIKRRRR
ncbi:MAG: hypothetical protein DRJ45_06140 [Thermoprotei archaeon]|nr:MAG: hypothetical protein DRJ45_06140 [Thermoprotei archaeon]